MTITEHTYTNSDAEFNSIKDFLFDLNNYPDVDTNWDAGRMDWWRYSIHAEKELAFFQANAHYWRSDSGKVVGLFISEYGGDDFFTLVHPEYADLLPECLNWGIRSWARGKQKIMTPIFTHDRRKVEQLLAAGFHEEGHESTIRTYKLGGYDFSYQLESGFELLSFQEYGNYTSRVQLVQNAFDNTSYTEARLRSLQSSAMYRAELDLVIVNSEGESVAYCMGWQEEHEPKAGYIEPMGVHSGYRRRGLATALAKECFRRLHDLGVDSASIASDAEPNIANFLYESLQPVSRIQAYIYALDLATHE